MPLSKARDKQRKHRAMIARNLMLPSSRSAVGRIRRDRDAIAAHLAWHHSSISMPDLATLVERSVPTSRDIALLEADVARLETMLALDLTR